MEANSPRVSEASDVFEAEEIFERFGCGGSSHGSTVCEGPDGEILAAWYGGSREKGLDVAIWLARKRPGEAAWSTPVKIEKESDQTSEGNPVLFVDRARERVWLFWVTMYVLRFFGGGWSTCKVKCKASEDWGHSWTAPRYLRTKIGWMTRNKPIQLANGDVVLPVYSEFIGYKSFVLRCPAREFAKGPTTSRWSKHGRITGNVMQPTIIERAPGHLFALMRATRNGRFGGSLAAAESPDHGCTWSRAWRSPLPNPNAGADMVKLANGHVALAFNNSPAHRNPLSVALSEDGGVTWPYIRDLEADPAHPDERFAYPALIQARDGTLHCTYTNSKYNIKHAALTEDWIRGG